MEHGNAMGIADRAKGSNYPILFWAYDIGNMAMDIAMTRTIPDATFRTFGVASSTFFPVLMSNKDPIDPRKNRGHLISYAGHTSLPRFILRLNGPRQLGCA